MALESSLSPNKLVFFQSPLILEMLGLSRCLSHASEPFLFVNMRLMRQGEDWVQ